MKQAERFFAEASILRMLDDEPIEISQGKGLWGTLAATTSGRSAFAIAVVGLLSVLIGALSLFAYMSLVQGHAIDPRALVYVSVIALGTIVYVWLIASPRYSTPIQNKVLLNGDGFECTTSSGKNIFTPFTDVKSVTRLQSGYLIKGKNKRLLRLMGPKGNAADVAAVSELALIFVNRYGTKWAGLNDTARRFMSEGVFEFHYGPSVWRVARNSALNFLRGALFITVLSVLIIIAVAMWGDRHEVLTPQSFQSLIELVVSQLLLVLLLLTSLSVARGLFLSPWFVGRVLPQRQYRGHVLEISTDGITYRPKTGMTAIAHWEQLRRSSIVQDGPMLRFIGDDNTTLIAFPFRFQRLRLMLELIRWGVQTTPAFAATKSMKTEGRLAANSTNVTTLDARAVDARVGLRRRRRRRAQLKAG